jgi:hypothetical protein
VPAFLAEWEWFDFGIGFELIKLRKLHQGEKNLGMSTPLKIARGANQLYRDGGLFYIPPIK